jgi:hypothetical protein
MPTLEWRPEKSSSSLGSHSQMQSTLVRTRPGPPGGNGGDSTEGTDDQSGPGVAARRTPSNDLLNERCANDARDIRVAVRCVVAGHTAGSRDGDSNPGPAHYEQSKAQRCVLTSATVHGTRITRERKRQSYQLSRRAARVDVVHTRQLTSRGSHQQALEPRDREVSFRSVPGSIVAQQHAGAIVKPRHPRVLRSMRSP